MTQLKPADQANQSVLHVNARRVSSETAYAVDYSICTLVTQPKLYHYMVDRFIAQGFTADRCEFLYLDNTKNNQGDGYTGLSLMLSQARGAYVILCHQDVIPQDPISRLDACIADLNNRHPEWALAGNAGVDQKQRRFFRITDRYRFNHKSQGLPAQVRVLDENFLVVRAESGIRPSHDLSGFHLYGTDLCLQAAFRGQTAWVINFHLEHTGRGAYGLELISAIDSFQAKYRKVLTPRVQRTNTTTLAIGRRSLSAAFRRQKQIRVATGKKTPPLLRRFSDWIENMPLNLHDALKGPNYALEGQTYRIPRNSAYLARKALKRDEYERPERRAVHTFLPRDCSVIELGGSFGIVSDTIRSVMDPQQTLVVVEAIPELADICRNNIRGTEGKTHIVSAALAYGADSIKFELTTGIHTSRVVSGVSRHDSARIIEVTATNIAQLRERYDIVGRYALVCDIEGAEYDLLTHEPEVLADCETIIMELHPAEYMDRGASVTEVLEMLSKAGFDVIQHEENTIVARNRSAK